MKIRYKKKLSHILFLLILFNLCNCSPKKEPDKHSSQNYNVILIVIDTLRADHLGCYRYKHNTSPQIDQFAKESTLYTRAIASSPWTLPTHASIFTGKFPLEHGSHTVKKWVDKGFPYDCGKLSHENVTLAEVFKNNGYKTAAFVANYGYLSKKFQLNQGFDTYYAKKTTTKNLNKKLFAWLGKHKDSQFFIFANYMDTHKPYNTSPLSVSERIYRKVLRIIGKPSVLDQKDLFSKLYKKVLPAQGSAPVDLVNNVIAQYDHSIKNIDKEIGILLNRLRQMGLYDNTVIVLTSDHGEYFGEHHILGHSQDVYNEALWVPLIIKSRFQKEGLTDDRYITSPDLPQMIFSQLPEGFGDRYKKQFPYYPGNHPIISENYYTRKKDLFHPIWGKRFDRIRRAIYEGMYKFIYYSDGNHELYNIIEDPGESDNKFLKKNTIAENMLGEIKRFHRGARKQEPERVDTQPLTQQQIEALKSLGYL